MTPVASALRAKAPGCQRQRTHVYCISEWRCKFLGTWDSQMGLMRLVKITSTALPLLSGPVYSHGSSFINAYTFCFPALSDQHCLPHTLPQIKFGSTQHCSEDLLCIIVLASVSKNLFEIMKLASAFEARVLSAARSSAGVHRMTNCFARHQDGHFVGWNSACMFVSCIVS